MMHNPRLRAPAQLGDSVASIDTPALVIDLDAMARNLATMATFAKDRGLRLRPHAKTHKSAQRSRSAGRTRRDRYLHQQ
jgi:D-serine deaminase-like pyridoxal phosphate-dependent protein